MTYLRLGAAVAAALLLVGCSSESDQSPSANEETSSASTDTASDAPVIGLPDGVTENAAGTAGAGLSPDGQLWIVTYGSSTNPLAVKDISSEGQTVTIGLATGDGPATMDMVASTSTVELPTSIKTDTPITVVLTELGSVTIDPSAHGTVVWLPTS